MNEPSASTGGLSFGAPWSSFEILLEPICPLAGDKTIP